MRWRRLRTCVVLLVSTAVTVAGCGLKPEVMEAGAGPEGAGSGEYGADGGLGLGPGGPGGGVDGGLPGGRGGETGTGAAVGGASGRAGGPGDTTGVTDKEIKIGIHAPVTGAAAFPQQSFSQGVGVYADFINRRGGINGRKLTVVFRDDKFNPNHARAVCKDLAEQEKVFLIVGGGGSDQIDACARYAASVGVPYVSAGVHETRPGLGSIVTSTFFALSLTYEQQVPLLVNLLRSDHAGKKVALLIASNDSLDNFYRRADAALRKSTQVVLSRRIPKNTGARDAPGIAREICDSGAGAVVWLASPSGLINVSKSMDPTCTSRVTFVGPGNTNGLNVVATGGCPQIDGAQFFSSFPGLDRIDSMDSDYKPAYRRKNGSTPDDIGIALWGTEKGLAQIMAAAGKDLSRQKFMSTLSSGKTFNNNIFPPVKFSGGSRFGGTGMHLLRARCSDREYKTQRVNARP